MNRTGFAWMALLVSAVSLPTGVARAATYHVDSRGGDDLNDGRTETTPWKSHTMAQMTSLRPGDVVLFRRGSQFSGPLHISESGTPEQPITLTAYGKGKAPRFTNPSDQNMNGNCIRLSGSYLIVEKLHFHDTPPTTNPSRLRSIFRMGAVFNMPGTNQNIIRDNTFTRCTKGIQSTGEFTLITRNVMDGPDHALWTRPGARGGWGPMGIQLGIGNQEVSYNTIKNYLTLDSPYGSDGGAIELDDGRYHKKNVYIHHNYSEGNAGFFESSWEADHNPRVQKVYNLRVAFNVSYDGQSFVYMHAPCIETVFDNNTVIRNNGFGSPMYDIVYSAFPGILFRNNLYVGTAKSFHGGPYKKKERVVARNNWFWNVDSAQSDGDPRLLNMRGKDFRLRGDSPLRRKALNLSKYYSTDFAGNPLPETGPWDIGAFSHGGSLSPEAASSRSDSNDSQTRVFQELGYNEVRSEAPIHLRFARTLPSNYGGGDADWEWESWKAGTESLLKDELFPLIGAYEHYYFLIDYEGYNADDEEIVALARIIGDSPNMTKDSFTGISGMHVKDDGWRVPLHMSRIPDDARCQRPEGCLLDRLKSSVIHEYHHIMMWHQMMNNYQSRSSGGTVAEPDYVPPWFGEGAAAVLPYLLGTENGRDGLRSRIEHVLDMVKTDPSLDFEHMKDWDTWEKPPLSFDPFIPLACYMAHRSSWQVALVDAFRAMGLQPHPGDFDALLVALVGVNERDFLNEALAFFRLESTTTDTLMPPDVPVNTLIGPPSLTTLGE